jgi:hypothetical protein
MESSVIITKVLGILELGSLGLGDTTLQPGTYRFSPFAPRVTRPWEIPRAEVQWWAVASNGTFMELFLPKKRRSQKGTGALAG